MPRAISGAFRLNASAPCAFARSTDRFARFAKPEGAPKAYAKRMKHTLLFLVSVGFLACSSSEAVAPSPTVVPEAAPPPAPLAKAACPEGVAFRDLSGKVVVDVEVNGKGPYTFLLDTGAPQSVLGKKLAASDDVTLKALGITTKLARVSSADMAQYKLPVDGVLGMDFVGKSFLTLDYPRKRVWLAEGREEDNLAACGHVGPAEDVPYLRKHYFFVKGAAESLEGWLLVDSGASLGVLMASAFTTLDAAAPRASLPGFFTPSGIGEFWARLSTVGSLRVGSLDLRSVVVRTADDGLIETPSFPDQQPFLGVYPSDALKSLMVTFDQDKSVVRLAPARDRKVEAPTKYFTYGIGLGDTFETQTQVLQVLPGSAASAAGVAVGDEVVAVGSATLAKLDPYERPWTLLAKTAGAKTRVTLRRGTEERTVELDARDLLRSP